MASKSYLSDAGLPLLSGQCQPISNCSASGYLPITPEELRKRFYQMLYDCNGSLALSPARCNNFVYLAASTLQRDAFGEFCLTLDGERKIYQLASAILPDFPHRIPINTDKIPPPSTPLVQVNYSASREEIQAHIEITRARKLNEASRSSTISTAEFNIIASSWKTYLWNGYSLEPCKLFPSYATGTTAYTKCAALICATFGMPDAFMAKMDTCCKENLLSSNWDYYCYRDPVQSYAINIGR
eukprot:CAMPEP_0184683392 /NCGR_PEP_ID=MMETSP0312-20130426/11099_1 /TAXON_ID=31354 /ORGANISM="Compsopogon coeruleus, Strain SAG 36.94" /LENGTH=241 /DNA_ID=CAMNT_0027135701 /DNA_START=11 /DNA_END=736 /DNA_ORIENTATION=-